MVAIRIRFAAFGRSACGPPSAPFDKKWIGIVLLIPNDNDGGAAGSTAGATQARVGAGHNPEDWIKRTAPSQLTVKQGSGRSVPPALVTDRC